MVRPILRPAPLALRRPPARLASKQSPSQTTSNPRPSPAPHVKPNLDASPSQLTAPSPSTTTGKLTVLTRLQARTPKPLQRYLTPLYTAPVSHISSFLILHEITAVVPLFLFAGLFHYTGLLPENVREWKYVDQGVEKWERYARRKGWIEDSEAASDAQREGGREAMTEGQGDVVRDVGGQGVRIVLELATAWAVTKVLLPVRLVGCAWATPWFARAIVAPVGRFSKRLFGRSSAT